MMRYVIIIEFKTLKKLGNYFEKMPELKNGELAIGTIED